MAATSPPEFELSKSGGWRGLQPGMTRGTAMAVIAAAAATPSMNVKYPGCVFVGDWGMELQFTDDNTNQNAEVLRQLSVDDDDYRWNGKKILSRRLHEALVTLGVDMRDAQWRPEDAASCRFQDQELPKSEAYADEYLLSEGTVWLPERGLALSMADGYVGDLVWRRAEDVPRTWSGRVTEAQLAISRRPDLDEFMEDRLRQRIAAQVPSKQRSSLEASLAVFLVLALAWVGRCGWQENRSWQQAVTLKGRLGNIETLPGKLQQKIYHIEVRDPLGHFRDVPLERADFYVAPTQPGEEVQVAYVEENSPQVRGLARARDAAFLKYMPWAMGVVLAYAMIKLLLVFLPARNRSGKTKVPVFC